MTDGERLVEIAATLAGFDERHHTFVKTMDDRHVELERHNRDVDERLTGISRSVSDTAATVRAMRNGNGNGSRSALAWGSMLVMGGGGVGTTIAFVVVNWPKG